MAKNQAQTTQETESNEQPAVPGLTLQDLISVAQIIQITSQRGVWRAEELAGVGTLYNKVVAFLEASGAISRNDSEEAPEGAEEQGHA